MQNSLEKAIVRIRNQGPVDFDVFDQRERALLQKFEEHPKSGLIIPSCCEVCSRSDSSDHPSRHIKLSQHAQTVVLSPRHCSCGLRHRQRPVFVAGFVVLLFASGPALYSRNFACPRLEMSCHCHIFQTRHQLWRRAPEHRSLTRSHSQRSLGVWRRCQNSSHLGILQKPQWEFLRDRLLHPIRLTTTASVIHDPTSRGGGV